MKATLELDDDVAARLQELCRERNVGLSEVVNQLLRRLFEGETPAARGRWRFTIVPVNLGKPALPDVDDVSAVIEYAEHLDSGDR